MSYSRKFLLGLGLRIEIYGRYVLSLTGTSRNYPFSTVGRVFGTRATSIAYDVLSLL